MASGKKKFVANTAILTGSSLFMRCIGMAYQVWLVNRIGSAGIGLFSLVMSVSTLAATFAISGIRYATIRLVSEEQGAGNHGGTGMAMRRCLGYSAAFSAAAFLLLYVFAERIGFLWVGDARTVMPLRFLAAGMPLVSLASVFTGYFVACGRIFKTAVVQIAEQLLRIALVAIFLSLVPDGDIELSCTAVVAGGVAADLFSLVLLALLYIADRRRYRRPGGNSEKLTSHMFSIAIPLAVSAYARTALNTMQQLLVPKGLKAAGYSADRALSGYGVIQGMVFPVITFPSCFLLALAEMLVPELTAAQVTGRSEYIRTLTMRLINKCLIFSLICAAVIFIFSDDLSLLIYKSAEAGEYIRIFSFMIPVMYMDMVVDGCLKGLGQMMYSMAINVAESFLGIIFVYFLLPRFALSGYIFTLYFVECFNFFFSMRKLLKIIN